MNKKIIVPPVLLVLMISGYLIYTYAIAANDDADGLFSGTLEATRVDIRAEVGGRVISLPHAEGDLVERGEIICEINKEKLELQLRMAEAQVSGQKAALDAMTKGARDQEIERVRVAVDQARAQLSKAERDYRRARALHKQAMVSDREYQDADTALKIAGESLKQAEASYQLVLEGARDEELRAQAAAVEAAEAQLELARVQVRDATLKSPLEGSITDLYAEEGELLSPGALVATVADYSIMELKVYVSEDRLGRVKLDQQMDVFIDSFPGKPFKGRVIRISEEAEFTPKNIQTKEERTTLVFEVKVEVQNPEGMLKAGLPADVKFKDVL